jgi:hypothetical protein
LRCIPSAASTSSDRLTTSLETPDLYDSPWLVGLDEVARDQAFAIDQARLRAHVEAIDPLVDSWLRDGLLLAGAPLRELIDSIPAGRAT